MFVTGLRQLLRDFTYRLSGSGRAWLFTVLCCAVLLVDMVGASAAFAQERAGGARPSNRRICDVSFTIVAGQTMTFNANTAQLSGNCTGTFAGTPTYAEGHPGPNGSDFGMNDMYPTLGVTAPVSRGLDGANGQWGTTDGTFSFTYQTRADAVGEDNFLVRVWNNSGGDNAFVYYHATVVPPAPTVTAVNPSSGGLGQTAGITITGTNFTQTGTSVTFGGVAAVAVTFNSSTELTATAPATATPGSKAVVVSTAGGQSSGSIVYRQYAAVTNAAAFAPPTVGSGAASTLTFTLTNPGTNPGAFSALAFSAAIPANLTLTNAQSSCGGSATIGGGTISLTGGGLVAGATCTVTASASSTVGGSYSITPAAVSGQGARGNADGSTQSTVTGNAGTAATLTVNSPPVVGTQPQNQTVAAGANASFTVSATGNPTPTVQWQRSVSGGAFADIAGATALTYTFQAAAADDGNRYQAVFTNSQGTATSNIATLTVNSPPAVTTNPQDLTVANNTTASFTAAASGNPAPTVQWQRSIAGGAFGNIAGATAPTYSFTAMAADNGNRYRAVFTNGSGSATTTAATLTVTQAPTVTTQPADTTVNEGQTANFTAAAAGNPAPTVQWEVSTDGGSTWAAVSGATSASLTLTAVTGAQNGNRYRAVFTNGTGTATSNAATLTVVQRPTANAQSVSVAFDTATPITLTGSDPNSPPRSLTYAIVSGPTHGTLTGSGANRTYTPTSGYAGSDSFTFTVNNGALTSTAATVTITVGRGSQTITFTSTAPANATVGGATYTVSATATSMQPVTFTSGSSGICTVSGSTVSFVGAGTCTINADQAGNASYDPAPQAQQSFAVAVPTITVAPANVGAATVGAAYSQAFTASGGTGPYTYTLTGSVPAGLSFAGNVLSGTPTQSGSFNFTVTAQDSSPTGPYSGSQAYTLTVTAATITVDPPTVPNPQVGVAYSQMLSATGGTAPYGFAVSGTLPTGLTLSGNTIQGTPTAGGAFTFQVTATDSSTGTGAPFSGTRSYSVTVQAATVTIAPTTLPAAIGGQSYTASITASGGTAPYTFTTGGPLPTGLMLATDGTLSGTPTQSGSFAFTVRATDSSSGTAYFADQAYTLTVGAPTITLAPTTLSGGTVGTAYVATVSASGGNGSYTYAVTAGSLPTGVSLSSGGAFSGTPTAGGSFGFTVEARDGNGFTGSKAYTLAIAAPTISVTPASLPGATRNVGYSQQLSASGGTAGYGFAITAGALPTGLVLSNAGLLSGTPTAAAGNYSFTVTATDSSGGTGPYSGSTSYTLALDVPTITLDPATVPAGTTRVGYSAQLSATGGTGPYGFAVTGGALPTGITVNGTGLLGGTTTTAGTFAFTVTATDANGNAGSRGYSLTITAPAITIAPTTLPAATTRVVYNQALTASGGSGSYGYAVTAGALPAGINLTTGGTLTGTANAAGSFSFTVTATDTNGNSGSQSLTLTVAAPSIALAPPTLSPASIGTAYAATLSASGGNGSYGYAVTAGALPAGIALSSGGAFSGTPTAGGSFSFTVTATDTNGNAGTGAYTLAVNAPTVTIAPTQVPAASTGVGYSQQLTASGGTAPYGYAVTAGALPGGMMLSTAGVLSGTPMAAGSFNFTVTATDASTGSGPFTGSQAYTLAVGRQAQTITFANPGARRLDQSPVTLTASASSGLAVTFASTTTAVCTVSGNSATLLRAGTCAITASQAGNGTFAPATDVAQSVQVDPSLVVAAVAQASVSATVGTPLNPTTPVTASGGTAPYGFTLASALPAGLTYSTAGQLSGTPTAGQAATAYAVTVTDANGQTASASFSLTVAAPTLALTPTTLPDGAFEVAYSQQLSASGGIAPYSYAVTAGALPGGVTLTAQGLLAGTPSAFGSFNVTITATDSATGNGPFSVAQAYTLAIRQPATPVAGAATATVAYGSADTVITPPLSGGTATTLAIATPPATGTVRVDGLTLVYTPRPGFGGSDSFTYTASNGGGSSAPATVTVTVTAPTVTITTTSLPGTRAGATYSQQLTATGGSAPYGFAVTAGALPAGLTLSPTGLLSGTPTTNGTATFTVTVTDGSTGTGPYRASQAFSLTIDLPPPPAVEPIPASTATGSTTAASTPITIALSDFITGDFIDIRVVREPRNGVLLIRRTGVSAGTGTGTRAGPRISATYTPNPGFSGTDDFAFVVIGPGGTSAPATVSIQVLGAAPVAAPLTAATTQGVPVTVDLTTSASGGPFTAARVTGMTPAGSVNTQLVEGGTAGNRSYRLTITPTLTFSGNATVSYALSNAFGESTPATIVVAVAARPDPSADPTINGLSAAQADATRRFANAQLQNFARRNEQLHNGGGASAGYTSNMSLTGGDPARQVARRNQDDFMLAVSGNAREVAGAEFANGTLVRAGEGGFVDVAGGRGRSALAGGTARATGDGESATGQPGTADGGDGGRRVGSVAIWSGGAIAVGTRDQTTQRDKLSVTTGGLSSGIDVKLTDNLIVGVGGGYGRDRTKLDGGAARVDGDAWSVAAYGSWSPTDGLFVDGVFGGGQLDFDTRRLVAQTNTVALGGREGKMLFGSLAFGFDRRLTNLDLSLYGRIDWTSTELDHYTETGGGIYSLTFAERDLTSVQGVFGGRLAFPLGSMTGRLRGEYRHEFNATGAQLLDYADIVNLRYRTRGDQWLRNAYTLDADLEAPLGRGWTGGVGVGVTAGSGAVAGTGRVELRKQFR